MKNIASSILSFALVCLFGSMNAQVTIKANNSNEQVFEVTKSDREWKKELSEKEYYVIREKGTERAFTGDLWDHKENCVYTCRACNNDLFDSETKFKSGSGWPSFYQPLSDTQLAKSTDYDLGYARTEIMCGKCGGHLGHVFNDGPDPTGLRYCINSVSLNTRQKD